MKKNYKLILILILVTIGCKVSAIKSSLFKDEAFYNCVIVKLNTDGFNSIYDRNVDEYEVTNEELESITVLKCNEANISDTTGIELLTNLTDLNLSDNNISTINLNNNTKISNLLLSNNKLSTIDLTHNNALENLYLNNNRLTSLNLSKNTELLVLNINKNKLASLDLSKNSKLIDFKAYDEAFAPPKKLIFKGDSLTLNPEIVLPVEASDAWNNITWITKNDNVANVNQKGTVKANKSGSVNIVASVEDVYSFTFNVQVLEATSEKYNIDDTNNIIAVDDAAVSTILKNIKVTNGEAMIYSANNKYVTSGNIVDGFKLKIMADAKVLKTYTLTLVKAIADNNLKFLEIKNYDLEFNPEKTTYTIIVESDVEALEVVAEAVDDTAVVKIEGSENLVPGTNTIKISVTGKDATSKTYLVNVVKKAGEDEQIVSTANVYLDKLEIANYQISFNPKIDYYDLKINADTTKLEINAVAADSQSHVEIKGNDDLKNKSKIEIIVTATDGAKKIYTLNIIKTTDSNFKLFLVILELLGLFLATILCIAIIRKHKRKALQPKAKKNKKEMKPEMVLNEETTAFVESKKIEDYTKSESYLEKTIRFRRVCPKCGTINVLTNDNCYLCGEKLEKE